MTRRRLVSPANVSGNDMSLGYEYLQRIVDPATLGDQRLAALHGFAEELGWKPSYDLQQRLGDTTAEDHLVVEHGLENTAVVSFFRAPQRPSELSQDAVRSLLSLSYNNLVDWHLLVCDTEVRYINNRAFPESDVTKSVSRSQTEFLSERYFRTDISARTLRPKTQPCDDLIISLVTRWKSAIKAEYRETIGNQHLSTLFNALIFLRGWEDFREGTRSHVRRVLARALSTFDTGDVVDFRELLFRAAGYMQLDLRRQQVLDFERLSPFSTFDRYTAADLIKDFYRPASSPYDFNFAFMSKHALSRIYERYVTILEFSDEEAQLSLLPQLPVERAQTKTGTVYTPQFIASFFAKYIREHTTFRTFRNIRTLDPACGSGIFLRSILEAQVETHSLSPQQLTQLFQQVAGVDRDPNACESTRLSLALLHLVVTGDLPDRLSVTCADAIQTAKERRLPLSDEFGAIVANPPYVRYDDLSSGERELYREYVGDSGVPRIDSYIAFMKLALEHVAEGGFICLVLPQTFLLADNAAFLRSRISDEFTIRCIVDLSSVQVFQGFGVYTLLLVIQKRPLNRDDHTPAQIVICQDFIGQALEACLQQREISTPYYSVFSLPQNWFRTRKWILAKPHEMSVTHKVSQLPRLGDVASVHQGVITGDDDIFVRERAEIPQDEAAVYRPLLPDREIPRFRVPEATEQVVLYPYVGADPISETDLQRNYPSTWAYLERHSGKLRSRKAVQSGHAQWWKPAWPRKPEVILATKIVCPHLMLVPRFAVDLEGRYLVTRSPFVSFHDPI